MQTIGARVETAPEVRAAYQFKPNGLRELVSISSPPGVRVSVPVEFRLFRVGAYFLVEGTDIGAGSTGETVPEAVNNLAASLLELRQSLGNNHGNNVAALGRDQWLRRTIELTPPSPAP